METQLHESEHSSDESPYYSGESISDDSVIKDPNETCPCCHHPNTTLSSIYWDCTLVELESASQDGCFQCRSIFVPIKVFAPDAFQFNNKLRIYDYFTCKLTIKSGARAREEDYELEIFRLLGD
jgi:hypothetical protein